MRRAGLLLVAAVLLLPASRTLAAPRLALVVVVDQLPAGLFERLAPKFTGGFRTLLEGGAIFAEAHHRHVPTKTAVGHAAILTGRSPGRHGIVGTDWWDRRERRLVQSTDDAVHGTGPEQLLSYTLGDALKAASPESIVVSLSLKPRAAVMLGGKKADLAVWLDDKAEAFATSSYYGPRPAWLDAFNAEARPKNADRHRLLLLLASRVLKERPLGADAAPDLLAIGFSETDAVGHRFGPDSRQAEESLLALDEALGSLLSDLVSRLGRDGLAVILTSDHGVMPFPESRVGKALGLHRIRPKRFEADVEAALQNIYPAAQGKWVERLVMPHLYLNRSLAQTRGFDWPALVKDAAKTLCSLEGVAQAFTADELASPLQEVKAAPSAFAEVYRESFFPGRSGDIMIRLKEDYLFSEEGTDHGSPYRWDTHVPLVFWGAGVKSGRFAEPVAMTDAAPTLAALLGTVFPPEPGSRVLQEALESRPEPAAAPR